MNKKGQIMLGALIVMFMGAIVVMAMLPSISDNTEVMLDKQTIINETVTVTTAKIGGAANFNVSVDLGPVVENASTAWEVTNCPISSITLVNETGSALTVVSDYNISTTSGIINMGNTSTTAAAFAASNTSRVSYTYCADGYISDSGARGVTRTILIFAALGLVGFVVYYAFKGLRLK